MLARCTFAAVFAAALLALGTPAPAQDTEANSRSATDAARLILSLLGENKLNTLWNNHVSGWYKNTVNKDVFMSSLSMGRAQLGPPQSARVSNVIYSNAEKDFRGDIYSVTFETVYPTGKFFERIVVIKEQDGVFRLSGLWVAPAPKD